MQLGNSPVLSVRIIRGLRSADNNVSVILRANLDVGQGSLVGCSGQLSLTSSSISTQRFKSLLCLAVQIVVIVVDNLLLRLSAGAVQSLLQSISSSAVAQSATSQHGHCHNAGQDEGQKFLCHFHDFCLHK